MTIQFPEVMFTVQTVHFSHSTCHPSSSLAQPLRTLPGLQQKMVMVNGKKEEEHVGLPSLEVSFPLDLPIPMEEEVIVREKTRKGHLSYMVII